MSALDGVLADVVESDRECAYVTVKRHTHEKLIEEWHGRGDQISILCRLVTRVQKELVAAWAGSGGVFYRAESLVTGGNPAGTAFRNSTAIQGHRPSPACRPAGAGGTNVTPST